MNLTVKSRRQNVSTKAYFCHQTKRLFSPPKSSKIKICNVNEIDTWMIGETVVQSFGFSASRTQAACPWRLCRQSATAASPGSSASFWCAPATTAGPCRTSSGRRCMRTRCYPSSHPDCIYYVQMMMIKTEREVESDYSKAFRRRLFLLWCFSYFCLRHTSSKSCSFSLPEPWSFECNWVRVLKDFLLVLDSLALLLMLFLLLLMLLLEVEEVSTSPRHWQYPNEEKRKSLNNVLINNQFGSIYFFHTSEKSA